MGLSCSCDFEKGEYERWYEPGGLRSAPSGTRCCECGAAIPEGDVVNTTFEFEVYEPEEERPEWNGPPEPFRWAEAEEAVALWDEAYGLAMQAIEAAQERYDAKYGFDREYERCERLAYTSFRCERCGGLAESIEDLGYCMIVPGELPEAHAEYVYEHSGANIRWVPDQNGVLNPKRQ